VEDVELPNSCAIVELSLGEIPLTSSGDSQVLCLLATKVNPFHLIFDLNKVLITTHFDKSTYGKGAFCIIALMPRLKEFVENCFTQCHVYIWYIA
jgi:hypothetical protein